MTWKVTTSRLLNVLTFGHKDELLSARIYERSLTNKVWWVVRILVDSLFFWEQEHCRQNYLWQYKQRRKGDEDKP